MEQGLRVELFSRSVKGIRLAKDGKYLYDLFAPQVEQFRKTLDKATAHFDNKPVELPFCCAPLIFRCLDTDPPFVFQNAYPNITLEQLGFFDADCDAYVEENSAHFGLLAIPANRHSD